jgi:hypothetical protein
MDALRELVSITDREVVLSLLRKHLSLDSGPSKLERLYLLIEGDLLDIDEDKIIYELYGDSRNHSAYKRLKDRLWLVLVNSVSILLGSSIKFSSYDEVFANGYKLLGIVKSLVAIKKYMPARSIAEWTFKRIKDYEIVALNAEFSDTLALLYLGAGYDQKKCRKYIELQEYYSQARYEEARLVNGLASVRSLFYANQSSVELADVSKEFADRSLTTVNKYPLVSRIQICYALLRSFSNIWRKTYFLGLQEIERAQAALKKCKGVSRNNSDFLDLVSLECTVYLRDFEKGKEKVLIAKSNLSGTLINKIKVYELSIRLGLVTKQYDYSLNEYLNCNFKYIKSALGEVFIQYWRILEAFVHLLVVTKQVEPAEDLPKLRPFRLNRFLNSIQNYEKNKHGLYVQVLILQMMFLIARREYNKVMDRVEGFDRFRRRYLKEKREFRNNCFYRLILKAVDANFNRVAAERMGKPILEKMINSPELEHREISDIEWIPYEDLWEILLGTLDSKRRVRAAKRSA